MCGPVRVRPGVARSDVLSDLFAFLCPFRWCVFSVWKGVSCECCHSHRAVFALERCVRSLLLASILAPHRHVLAIDELTVITLLLFAASKQNEGKGKTRCRSEKGVEMCRTWPRVGFSCLRVFLYTN